MSERIYSETGEDRFQLKGTITALKKAMKAGNKLNIILKQNPWFKR